MQQVKLKLNIFKERALASIRKHWLKYFLIANVLIVAISVVVNILFPYVPVEPVAPSEDPIIGQKFSLTPLYNPELILSYEETPRGTEYKLKSEFPAVPHIVVTNKNDEVIFVKKTLLHSTNQFLEEYILNYGQPDLVFHMPYWSEFVEVHVFLDEGLAIVAHIKGNVEQIWSFSPTDEESFLELWGQDLETEGDGPEGHFGVEPEEDEADIEIEPQPL